MDSRRCGGVEVLWLSCPGPVRARSALGQTLVPATPTPVGIQVLLLVLCTERELPRLNATPEPRSPTTCSYNVPPPTGAFASIPCRELLGSHIPKVFKAIMQKEAGLGTVCVRQGPVPDSGR